KKKKQCASNVPRILPCFAPCNSFTLIPVIYDKYAGNIGSTQGDKKDNAPAPNANTIPTNKNVSVSIPPIVTPSFYYYTQFQAKQQSINRQNNMAKSHIQKSSSAHSTSITPIGLSSN